MPIARKRFGQNFLVDGQVIDRIIQSIAPTRDDRILEIGPGQGALTGPLVASGCDLTLVEIDRDLADQLASRYPETPLVRQDILKTDLGHLLSAGQYRVVGNLPYNISTPLLFRLFHQASLIRDMHFMLQLEVVDRMTAETGTKAYGRLSIMTQLFCDAEKLFEVPAEAFSPRPKVRSAIIRLSPRVDPAQQTAATEVLEQLLIQAFSARRKTVRNALRGLMNETQLMAAGIDPGVRPENLTVQQYAECARLIRESTP